MNKNIQIIFKKNSDNSYDFSNIFVVPVGKEAQLDVAGKGLVFCSGLVCTISEEDIIDFFQSNSNMVQLSSYVKTDDTHDEYFSILVTAEQVNKWIPRFQSGNDNDEDALLAILAQMFKKCDGIDKLNIISNSDGVVTSNVSFIEDRDEIRLRSTRFLQKVLGLSNGRPAYDYDISAAMEMADSLGIKMTEYHNDDINNDNVNDEEDEFSSNMDNEVIISEIKKRVIAQDEAVESIVNNIYTNQKIIDSGNPDFIEAGKVNILLDGPTGTGKTLIVEQAAKQLSIPVVVRPIVSFTTAGYKGADLTEMLTILLEQADGNLELAERGIIALDEFDKLSYSEKGLEIKPALQQELLSYLGGGRQLIDYRGRRLTFDTSKITFIGFGSFEALREKKIQEKKNKAIGFINDNNLNDRTYTISIQDYIDFGIQKEIIGRFSLFTHTNALNHDDLVRIMKESSISPISALIDTGKLFGVEIIIPDEIIDKIADYALEDGTGARGIKTITTNLRDLLLGKMISSRIDRVVVDEELLNKSRMKMVRSY